MRIGEWLQFARIYLDDALARRSPAGQLVLQNETGSLEAQVLLTHVLEKPRAWILAHREVDLEPAQVDRLTGLLARLRAGEPLSYLIGHWEFYGLNVEVTPAVLIPRPETELLVEQAIAWLQQHHSMRQAADVGTGSGCIAITLAKHVQDLNLIAVDRSREALQVAQRNAARQNVTAQITFMQGDLLTAVRQPMDLICANLPYIPETSLNNLPVAKYEPHLALGGGPDGLRYIRALLEDASRWLAPQGMMLLEMQFDQGEAITRLAQSHLPEARVEIIPDLAGLPRVVAIESYTGM